MKIFLMIFGWYMVIAGAFLVIKPSAIKKLAGLWYRDGKLSRVVGLAPIIVGAALWWSVPASRLPVLIQLFAVLSIFKGIYFLVAPQKQVTASINWWMQLSTVAFLIWGFVVVCFGVATLINL